MAADWARATDLFHRALDVPPVARDAFLDEATAGDSALRAEVASLLVAHARSAGFLEQAAVAAEISFTDIVDHALGVTDALVGQDLGQYRILRVLGAGGMGVVYLADDTRLGRRVALKAVAPRFTGDAARRDRLTREARAAASLTHPGIATVYALEEFDGRLYLAGEYIPGETLRTEVSRGPLAIADVLQTALLVSRALAAAHERGIVHRDLKPENLIRTPAGELKILDFGLARFRDDSPAAATLTGDGTILGTPAYMSPEQIRGETVDFRSDLFAFGIVLSELASGTHPFAAEDPASTIARILEREPRQFLARPAGSDPAQGASSQLEAIIRTCLQKDAASRYRATSELVGAIERASALLSGARAAGLAPQVPALPPAGGGRPARWWWEFHQAAASAAYVILLVPLWLVHTWTPGLPGLVLFLCGLTAALVASTLRTHLLFTSKSLPAEHAEQHRFTSRWIRLADLGFAVVLAIGSVTVLTLHAPVAVILLAAAVAVVLACLVIEPATTRAAFGDRISS